MIAARTRSRRLICLVRVSTRPGPSTTYNGPTIGPQTRSAAGPSAQRNRALHCCVLIQTLTSDSPSVEGLGALLQSFRTRAGLSQADLAEQAGLSAAAIGAIEQGTRRRPHQHTLTALASALRLAPAERDSLL